MSAEQRKLKLWLQNTSNVIRRWELTRQRNTILHAMRRKARSNNRSETGHAGVRRRAPPRRRKYVSRCFRNVEAAGCKTYHSRRSRTCVIPQCRSQCARENIRDASVYTNAVTTGRTYYSRSCAVCNRLNSGRASGYVGIPAELFKCTADLLAHTIANSFNEALEVHEQLGLGNGVLILLQRPGNPIGPLTSLRPIVLLSALRKTLSLIVLTRITPKTGLMCMSPD